MLDHDSWRDRQLNGFSLVESNSILAQEKVMLDFVTSQKSVSWCWMGNNTNFKSICRQHIVIDNENAQGLIIYGKQLINLTTAQLITKLKKIIQNYSYVYAAIDRYEIIKHDLDLELPDSMSQTLDLIMTQCHPRFKRLCTFDEVDGNHMVAAHPMDCYGLCKL